MPASPEDNASTRSLSVYVNALWGLSPRYAPLAPSPQEADVPACCILSGGNPQVLHLPLHAAFAHSEIWRQAAASHASAHWHFGGPPMPRGQLKLVQQALLGVLEDARVEWLAMQRFPGLRAVWLHFHAGPDAAQGNGFEALLARLARCLVVAADLKLTHWVNIQAAPTVANLLCIDNT